MTKKPAAKTRRTKATSGTAQPKPATRKRTAKKTAKKSARKSVKRSSSSATKRSSSKKTAAEKKAKTAPKKKRKTATQNTNATTADSKSKPSDASQNERSLAEAFRYCPSCGSKTPQPGQIPFRCRHCEFTFFFGPVAAVGGLILNEKEELLLVRRARDPGKHQWGLPGGFVDREEVIEEALRREVYEETRLRVSEASLMMTYPNHYVYGGFRGDVIDLFYLCRVKKTSAIRLADDELTEYQWCIPGRAELNNMAFASNKLAIETWLKQRKKSSR